MFTCMMQAQVDSSEQLHAFEKCIQCIPSVGLLHCAMWDLSGSHRPKAASSGCSILDTQHSCHAYQHAANTRQVLLHTKPGALARLPALKLCQKHTLTCKAVCRPKKKYQFWIRLLEMSVQYMRMDSPNPHPACHAFVSVTLLYFVCKCSSASSSFTLR